MKSKIRKDAFELPTIKQVLNRTTMKYNHLYGLSAFDAKKKSIKKIDLYSYMRVPLVANVKSLTELENKFGSIHVLGFDLCHHLGPNDPDLTFIIDSKDFEKASLIKY